jgi:methionyl-tRNA formyltransferase
MRIVFMGTPEFAVPSLQKLIKSGHDIVAVVTAPDKVQGRGMQQTKPSEVKAFALSSGLPVLQPEKLRDPAFVQTLQELEPDLGIVVAFRMLPQIVWSLPRLGTFNLHGSLLPRYRGAAPIHWAVINGENQTGVTTFMLKHQIDTGDLMFQATTPIEINETTGDVYQRLMHIGADLVVKTVEALQNGSVTMLPQDENLVCPAPKLDAHNTKIDFNTSAQSVHNLVRGLQPYPTAHTTLNGKILKIHQTAWLQPPLESAITHKSGTLFESPDKRLMVMCADGSLEILVLQPESSKRLSANDFLNGYRKTLPAPLV